MKKKRQEEQAFLISGWQNRDENDSQSEICLKRLKSKMEALPKNNAVSLQKLPSRDQNMHKSKKFNRWQTSQISNLKKDKQLLQKYLWSEKDFKPDIHCKSCQQQDYVALKKGHIQAQAGRSKNRNYRLTEVQERINHEPEQPFRFIQKYTLFSGIKTELNKKRRLLLRANSKENMPRPKLKTDLLSNNALMTSKYYPNQIGKSNDQKQILDQMQKKKMTFPMYFRQLALKQQKIRKYKHSQTMNLQPSKKLKYSAQFMDDNIFSSKRFLQ